MPSDVFVHPAGINESDQVGKGTRIWAFAHVLKGAVIGEQCNIGDHCFVETGARLGNGVTLKNGVSVWEGVTLEDFSFVGPNAVFTNDKFPRSPRLAAVSGRYADKRWLVGTTVRAGATIGANAIIVCGVTIGCFAMVAAGALVTRDVPDFVLAVGCPAEPAGYACLCGQRLPEGREPKCASCGRSYRKEKSGLAPLFELRIG
ncbi:MAG: acyltransferase [Verrucomicrobiota bacterium]